MGCNSTILCYEFLIKIYITGPMVIGRDVMVGANTTILLGVHTGMKLCSFTLFIYSVHLHCSRI
jgi:hypothetical protein